jgi:hypothetical protein
VRQAVAGAAQAAGRAIAAAQAGAATGGGNTEGFRQPGVHVVVPNNTDTAGHSSSPIVLTPPRRSAFTAALGTDDARGAGAGSPRTTANVSDPQQAAAAGARGTRNPAAAQWEPAFPQAGAGEQQQQQQGGSWVEGGWSNVAL